MSAEGSTPAEEYALDDPGPPVGQRRWADRRVPSPSSGFAAGSEIEVLVDEALGALVDKHRLGGLGRCACGEDWVCPTRRRAVAELLRRGVERRPVLEGP